MTIVESAERLGAAATLLSLDRILPFHAAMGTRPPDSTALKDCVRSAIEKNRQAFAANPGSIPDLRQHLSNALAQSFGEACTPEFFAWYEHDFVHTTKDFPQYPNWYQFFSRLYGQPSRWQEVVLPERVKRKAVDMFAQAKDVSELQAIDEQADAVPMSSWDTQMFALHRLYAQGREPISWVLETVRKRRFDMYVKWLADALDNDQRLAFVESARALKQRIPTFDGSPDFPPLFERTEEL